MPAPGEITALDTHWIWQDDQGLTTEPLQIKGSAIAVPDAPGLGIELDREALDQAHQLYLEHGLDARDDSIGMQYHIDGWSFDPKRACLVPIRTTNGHINFRTAVSSHNRRHRAEGFQFGVHPNLTDGAVMS